MMAILRSVAVEECAERAVVVKSSSEVIDQTQAHCW
jgi:hypothetical protein